MSRPDTFQRLNEEFYASTPSTYFRDRLKFLAIRAVRPDVVEAAIGEGVQWGPLRLVHDDADPAPDAAALEEAAQTRFIVIESQVLLHHVSESLLRMYIGHAGRPACPWLEMASLKDPGEFPKLVGDLAQPTWPQEWLDSVGDVFLGGVPADPPDEWLQARTNAVRLLRYLAARFNADSQLYNAAKHGMTSIGGTGSVHVIPDGGGEAVTAANGVNIVFLEREGRRKTGYTWFHKSQWLSPEKSVWLTQLALIQMDALWTMARWHYLDQPPPDRLQVLGGEALEALKTFNLGGPLQSFRREVATETAVPRPQTSEGFKSASRRHARAQDEGSG